MILEDILVKLKQNSNDKAYTINNKSYTYLEFYKFICNIYKFLLLNNKEKKPIIVYGSKEIYMKSAFLACSYAGITYVPIDESIPKERVKLIIKQVNPYCIIGDFEYKDYKNISKEEIYKIMINEQYEEINTIYLKSKDIYYMIFTSGSTGIPKGVKVTYKNVDSCINWLKDITKIKKGVVLNQAIFSFDLSVADLYLSVISGSEHFILENNKKLDLAKTFTQLKLSNTTIAVLTPSFADLLLLDKTFGKELLPNLKTIIFCGERLLNTTVKKIYSRFKDIIIINSYGPTECTFAVTSIEVTLNLLEKENIPVGIPKNDVEIAILDENKNKLSDNKTGEILIAGESVAEGYVGDTNQNTFIIYNGKKAYLTGDMGYVENGCLYYVCRKDDQVKYKGYRIELSDIEENFYKLNYIEKVKVIIKKTEQQIVTKLIAFIKLKENVIKSKEQIKKDLLSKIPEYMVPNIKILDEFPINNNGKIDTEKLRRMINGR